MTLRMGEAEAGMRLDAALAARGAAGSRSEAQRLIDRGRVTVDGHARPKSHRVSEGEVVEVAPEPASAREEPVDVEFEVVWEDEHLMVVDKPAGVVVHPGAGVRRGTLAQALAGLSLIHI